MADHVRVIEPGTNLTQPSPKHLAVLNAVAEQGGYGKPLPPGVFRGISQMSG